MSFWTYILHCRGGYFYVGHAQDLDRRIAEHESGLVPGFASDHQPIKLAWSENFPSRIEALEAERRIKGWSRAKKMALIRGDWDGVSRAAKSKTALRQARGERVGEAQDQWFGAGTSPNLVGAEPVEILSFPGGARPTAEVQRLIPHPFDAFRPFEIFGAAARSSEGALLLHFHLRGDLRDVILPPGGDGERRDELWKHSCFEAFVQPNGQSGYHEINITPGRDWQVYRFSNYRDGIERITVPDPAILVEREVERLRLAATIKLAALDATAEWNVGLSAVIEEIDGTKSYWALAHPPGAPDFHHRDCFALELAAAQRA